MKAANKLVLLTIVVFVTISCKKKNQQVVNNYNIYQSESPYQKTVLPISKGSYWIYDIEVVDITNLSKKLIEQDSIVVETDSLINGRIYNVVKKYITLGSPTFQGAYNQEGFYRDSSGYNVTPTGAYFDQNDFESIKIVQTLGGTLESKLLHAGVYSGKAGEFKNTINYSFKFEPINLSYTGVRYMNNYFVSGIGLIESTGFYIMDPNHYFEKTLKRYSIK